MIALEVDEIRLQRLADELKALPVEAERAFQSSLREMTATLRTRGVRRMREILGGRPTARELRGRWFIGVRRREGRRWLWIGANPFNAAAYMTAAQARSQSRRRRYVQVAGHTRSGHGVASFRRRYQAGVTVQGQTYGQGFFAPVASGLQAFERDGPNMEFLRHPIEDTVNQVARELFHQIPERFYERFEQQLQRRVEMRA